jgi:transcriptional regulator
MYQPPHFREDDRAALHALIAARPLGLLVTSGAGGLQANAVPFLLDGDSGNNGLLRAHLAKANPQWRDIGEGVEALVVFQGEDAYVTPSWYETKRQTGKVVPTWNYAMVQVRGTIRAVEDAAWLYAQVSALTRLHEATRAEPWSVGDAPEAFVAAQLKGIVGIEIAIREISGKWKVSQNRPAADVEGVAEGMANADEPHGNAAMAALVRRYGAR